MSKGPLQTCTGCGAPLRGRVCEFCGTRAAARMGGDTLIQPFLADRDDALRCFYTDLERSRRGYEDTLCMPSLFEILQHVRATPYFVPVVHFEGEVAGKSLACAIADPGPSFARADALDTLPETIADDAVDFTSAEAVIDSYCEADRDDEAPEIVNPGIEAPSDECYFELLQRLDMPRAALATVSEKVRWRICFTPVWMLEFKLDGEPWRIAADGTTGRMSQNRFEQLHHHAMCRLNVSMKQYLHKQEQVQRAADKNVDKGCSIGCAALMFLFLLIFGNLTDDIVMTAILIGIAAVTGFFMSKSTDKERKEEKDHMADFEQARFGTLQQTIRDYYMRTYGTETFVSDRRRRLTVK